MGVRRPHEEGQSAIKAVNKILIRRRLDTLMKLVNEYVLSMDVTLVKSSQNKADQLTRVPQKWIDAIRMNTEPIQSTYTAFVSSVGSD